MASNGLECVSTHNIMRPNRIAVERSWRPAGARHMHISAIHATGRYPATDGPVAASDGLDFGARSRSALSYFLAYEEYNFIRNNNYP